MKEGVKMVSHERIYQYIWADKEAGGKCYTNLCTQGKKYRKRGTGKDKRGIIPNRVSIEERPRLVGQRQRTGDLEIDTIIGKNHKGAILTINDRATGQLKMKKLSSKNADQLAEAAIGLLKEQKEGLSLRRSYVRTTKKLVRDTCNPTHPKRRKRAASSQRKLKTIAGRPVRELDRKLPQGADAHELALFNRVLSQTRNSQDKIYRLHEPDV